MGETKATEQCDSISQIHSMKYWLVKRDSQFMHDDNPEDIGQSPTILNQTYQPLKPISGEIRDINDSSINK